MVVSSVSPERWEMTRSVACLVGHVRPVSMVSLRVPIWLTLTRMLFAVCSRCRGQSLHVGDEEVVADELHGVAEASVRPAHPSQSSSSRPSSMEISGYSSAKRA